MSGKKIVNIRASGTTTIRRFSLGLEMWVERRGNNWKKTTVTKVEVMGAFITIDSEDR